MRLNSLFVNERKGEWKRGDVLLRCERNALWKKRLCTCKVKAMLLPC